MTTPANPGRMLFVNIPVADLERSKAFFSKLGFSYDPAFTDETAACMLVGEQAFVMLLGRETFAQYAKLPIADPTTHTLDPAEIARLITPRATGILGVHVWGRACAIDDIDDARVTDGLALHQPAATPVQAQPAK